MIYPFRYFYYILRTRFEECKDSGSPANEDQHRGLRGHGLAEDDDQDVGIGFEPDRQILLVSLT